MRSITGSWELGPEKMIQNPDQMDLPGKTDGTSLLTASSRTNLDIKHGRNDEPRDNKTIDARNFPVLRPNFDQQAHTHHSNKAGILETANAYLKKIFFNRHFLRNRLMRLTPVRRNPHLSSYEELSRLWQNSTIEKKWQPAFSLKERIYFVKQP